MAKENLRPLALRYPTEDQRGKAHPIVRYDPQTDSLLLYLYGQPEAAINVDVADTSMYVMVDPDTWELIGVHIQAFRKRFLAEHPYYLGYDVVQHLINPESAGSSGEDQWKNHPDASKALAELIMGNLVVEHGALAASG